MGDAALSHPSPPARAGWLEPVRHPSMSDVVRTRGRSPADVGSISLEGLWRWRCGGVTVTMAREDGCTGFCGVGG